MARPRAEEPTPAELDLLKILWDRSPRTVREVLAAANAGAETPRAYTSVMSLLNVMADKGLVRRIPQGRAFAYEPAAPREQTLREMLGAMLRRAFDGSAAQLVAHLIDPARPDRAEVDEIRRLLDSYQDDPPAPEAGGRPCRTSRRSKG